MLNLPPGFLGTRADVFMDVVIVIVALVPALLFGSRWLARSGRLRQHRQAQILLSAVFAVVVGLFEVYIRVKGGVDGISPGSSFHESTFLYAFLAVHLCFAVSSALLWIWLFVVSLRRFPNPPAPGAFSAQHQRWGRITMGAMMMTAITGLGLYGLCFVA